MKNFYLKLVLTICAAATISTSAQAQSYLENPNYGSTPEERTKNATNISLLSDAINGQEFNRAVELFQQIMKDAPKASLNIYGDMIKMYKFRIMRAQSVAEKNMLIDSLMIMHDLRIKNLGDHKQLGRHYSVPMKIGDYIELRPQNRAEAMKMMAAAIAEGGNDADPNLVNQYFSILVKEYKDDEIETDLLMSEYERLGDLLDASTAPEAAEAKKQFDNLFIASGAANCENLEKVMAPKIAAAPDDLALLKKTFTLLGVENCDSEFRIMVAEKIYAQEPSSAVAMFLAMHFENKGQTANSIKYLQEAIANEKDQTMISNLTVRMAGAELTAKNYSSAAKFARQAIDIDPNNAAAYYILASAQALGNGGCGEYERSTVFWLVYDNASKARELAQDEGLKEQATALMNSSRANFPPQSESFFRDNLDGSAINVNCGWISGRTIVRSRPN